MTLDKPIPGCDHLLFYDWFLCLDQMKLMTEFITSDRSCIFHSFCDRLNAALYKSDIGLQISVII